MKHNVFLFIIFIAGVSILPACKATTILLANFGNDKIDSPPGPNQTTGTVSLNEGSGTIRVVGAPGSGLPPGGNWAKITHTGAPSPETILTGTFSRFIGIGNYSLLVAMYIPEGAGVATVEFESTNPSASFLHLDFMAEGNIRIDDSNTRFGHFPRNKSFVLSVGLNITNSSATADISLAGGSASGNITVPVQPNLLSIAKRFEAVKFWIGYQHNASFFVDDILVTRRK